MKVSLIHSVFLSHRNGVNTVLHNLINNKDIFASQGIELKVLAPDTFQSRSFETSALTLKDRMKRLVTQKLTKMANWSSLCASLMMYIREVRFSKKMAIKYLNTSPDVNEVVFVHSFFLCYYYLKYRSQKQKVVLVLHNNGDTFKMYRTYYKALEKSFYYKLMLKMEAYVLSSVDRINFVSKNSKKEFLKLHPSISPDKVFYIYNGIDNKSLSRMYEIHRPIEICCVASISERKGQRNVIEALKNFGSVIPNVHFTFIGEGEIRPSLELKVKEYNLENYVTFVGVSNDVESYLSKSDIFMLPSMDEGLPMSIIEAMRAGLPIVSCPVGGIPEMVVTGENGVLIEPSIKGVYEFLSLIDKYDWGYMSKRSRLTFEQKFTSDKMVAEYCNLLTF